jgi:hypothetical protein
LEWNLELLVLIQKLQQSQEQYMQLAREHSESAINQNTEDHNKKAYPRKFKEGKWVLLEVKTTWNPSILI